LLGEDGLLGNLAEAVAPGSTSPATLTGNLIGHSGVLDDIVAGLETGELAGAISDAYDDLLGVGGAVDNLTDGRGLGVECLMDNLLEPVGLVEIGGIIGEGALDGLIGENGLLGNLAEAVAPGSTSPATLTGNLIGHSGVLDDIVAGLETGDLAGAISNSYDDLLGVGGVVNNLSDGRGLGIEGLMDNVLEPVGLIGIGGIIGEGALDGVIGVNGLLGNLAEAVAPGSTSSLTLTGNLIGNNGVLDDIVAGLETGELGDAISASYDDLLARGGVVNNLSDGHGLGAEGVLGDVPEPVGLIGVSGSSYGNIFGHDDDFYS
ncbi:hypothetical protein A7A09_020230, partial [Paracoccus methylarcula]